MHLNSSKFWPDKYYFSQHEIKNNLKAITVADRATELNLIEQLNGYTFLSGIYGEDSSESDESFVLIPLQNLDENISHCFELGYITKTGQRMNDISLTYIDVIRRILHIAGFTC